MCGRGHRNADIYSFHRAFCGVHVLAMFKPQHIIRERVMVLVNSRIDSACQEFDAGIGELEAKLEKDKEALMEKIVSSITDKIF